MLALVLIAASAFTIFALLEWDARRHAKANLADRLRWYTLK